MTIAEMLVQTTATLMSGIETPEYTAQPKDIECATAHARAIVAAIYGEPCGVMSDDHLPFAGTRSHPADECIFCRWPRSQHEAKP